MSTNYRIDPLYTDIQILDEAEAHTGKELKVCETCNKLMLNIFGEQTFQQQKTAYYCSKWCWSKRHIRTKVD